MLQLHFRQFLFYCKKPVLIDELELGKYYEVPVIFLDRDLALTNLSIGKNIILWEGKEVASGSLN
jgi:hypothetical protein